MNSLWKDLLFLHGHLVHKEDLDWRPEPKPAPNPASDAAKARRNTLACCAGVWPRIMAPR